MKTAELIEEALDWAVAMAYGYVPAKYEKRSWGKELVPAPDRAFSSVLIGGVGSCQGASLNFRNFGPSSDWATGGVIMANERIWPSDNCPTGYVAHGRMGLVVKSGYGPTVLIAVMRCFVAMKLGDEVEIPEHIRNKQANQVALRERLAAERQKLANPVTAIG